MQRSDVSLVTHHGLPEGAPDDLLLADALRAKGLLVRLMPWRDPHADWAESRLTVVRSAWDYHLHPKAWLAWIDATSNMTRLLNDAPLLRWSTDKRYLLDLLAAGVPCIPTCVAEPNALFEQIPLGSPEWIIKPAVGASARGVRRFSASGLLAEAKLYVNQLAREGAVLIQPFVAEVQTHRERSLVYFDGEFCHAFTKPAFATNATGRTAISPHPPTASELLVARAALDAVPGKTAYARVDLVPTGDGPQVMELELIEPDLGLRLSPAAIRRLTDVCLGALDRG